MILKAEMKEKMYLLINIYAPNKDTNLAEVLKDLTTTFTLQSENLDEEENTILGGDFNCPLIWCSIRNEVYFYASNL